MNDKHISETVDSADQAQEPVEAAGAEETTDEAGTSEKAGTSEATPADPAAPAPAPAPAAPAAPATVAVFRAHAAARLRGDRDEAARLARRFTDAQRRVHVIFVQILFAAIVVDRLGARPDPEDLADFTKRLHDKRFGANGTFNALRAEALIRSLFGEEHLLFEVPFSEQPGYMWAVMETLVDPGITDDELEWYFRESEEFGRVSLEGGLEAALNTFCESAGPAASQTEQAEQVASPEPTASAHVPGSGPEPDPGPALGPDPEPDPRPTLGPDPAPGPAPAPAPEAAPSPGEETK